MTHSLRPMLLVSIVCWLVITFYGIYFLAHMRSQKLVNLGIDLVGGYYLTLDVKVEEALKNELVSAAQSTIDKLKKEKKALPVAVSQIAKNSQSATQLFSSEYDAQQAYALIQNSTLPMQVSREGKALIYSFTSAQLHKIKADVLESNVSVLRTRLDALGAGEITIVPQGDRQIVVELPNVSDAQTAKSRIGTSAVLEIKEIYDYGSSEQELLAKYSNKLPEGTILIPGSKETAADGYYLVPRYAKITGKQLRDVRYGIASQDIISRGTPHIVILEFNATGGEKFYELTKANIGGQIAVIIDNKVVSAPQVKGAVTPGATPHIQGDFTQERAQELVTLLKSGSFIAPVEIVEERHIGPSLGQESIYRGLLSCAIALGLLLLFSIGVYKVAGIFAFVVLLYNLLLIMLGLARVPDATLTLPGIAGMVLTVGMAIDSSILIYERIKEELAAGSAMRNAVNTGFSGATGVILDANITTFIVGIVLYYFGSPAIQGFALTMMLGIISTLVTGLLLLRLLFTVSFDVFGFQKIKI
jgi:preprotein translocase subunit SecD